MSGGFEQPIWYTVRGPLPSLEKVLVMVNMNTNQLSTFSLFDTNPQVQDVGTPCCSYMWFVFPFVLRSIFVTECNLAVFCGSAWVFL